MGSGASHTSKASNANGGSGPVAESKGASSKRSSVTVSRQPSEVKSERRSTLSPFLIREANRTSAAVLNRVIQADDLPSTSLDERLQLLRQCQDILRDCPRPPVELFVLVYGKEGEYQFEANHLEESKEWFSRAIALAEKEIALRPADLFAILKRYVLAMIGLAHAWFAEEKKAYGFDFNATEQPAIPPQDQPPGTDGSPRSSDNPLTDRTGSLPATFRASSVISMTSSVTSAGTVFSLTQAMLKSMIPRDSFLAEEGPAMRTLKIDAPRKAAGTEYIHEVEANFTLNTVMTKELVASPSELLLLRCCEVVELAHCRQSELLHPVLCSLANLYESLGLYRQSILQVRRCVGVLLSAYDYDHPLVTPLRARITQLSGELEKEERERLATKIQSVWRMYVCMRQLEETLGRPVHRHSALQKKDEPDIDNDGFLNGFLLDQEPGSPRESEANHALTAHIPGASAIGSTQECETEMQLRHGAGKDGRDVLTVQTTTVSKTVAEATMDTESDMGQELPANPSLHITSSGKGCEAVTIPIHPKEPVTGSRSPVSGGTVKTVHTATTSALSPVPEGNLLTVKQVTVTKTITEKDSVSSVVAPSDDDWRKEDLYSGMIDETASESTFFTHRSSKVEPPVTVQHTATRVVNEPVRSSCLTSLSNESPTRHSDSNSKTSVALPSISAQPASQNRSSTPTESGTDCQTPSPRSDLPSRPTHSAPPVRQVSGSGSGSQPSGLPSLRMSSNHSPNQRSSGTVDSASHSHVSSIIGSARRSRAWVAH